MRTVLLTGLLVTLAFAELDPLNPVRTLTDTQLEKRSDDSKPVETGSSTASNEASMSTLLSDRTILEIYEQVFQDSDGTIHTHTVTSSASAEDITTPPNADDIGKREECGRWATTGAVGPNGKYMTHVYWDTRCPKTQYGVVYYKRSDGLDGETPEATARATSARVVDADLEKRYEEVYDDNGDGKMDRTVTEEATKPTVASTGGGVPTWLQDFAKSGKINLTRRKQGDIAVPTSSERVT